MDEESPLPDSLIEQKNYCYKCGSVLEGGEGIRINVDTIRFDKSTEICVKAESSYFCAKCAKNGINVVVNPPE